MRMTLEQRIQALERESVVLSDTIKLLHKLLKDQNRLINEYITHKASQAADPDNETSNSRPENELYTFICQKRFDQMEDGIRKMRKLMENLRFGLKAS